MPSIYSPNQGAPSGQLNSYDFKHIGLVFLAALAGFVLTWAGAVLIPDLQSNGIISAALATMLTTMGAAVLRLINNGQAPVKLLILAVGLCLCSCGVSIAGDIAVVVPSTPGSYLLSVDALGGVVLSPLDKVVRVNPMPPGPIPPTPGPLTDNATKIRDSALKVTGDSDRATTAKGLAELYRQIANLVRNSQIHDQPSLVMAVHMATDNLLASRGAGVAAKWQPVRDVFSTEWTVLSTRPNPPTILDFASLLDEAASGLDASAPGKAIDPALLQLIMQIIQLVLQLLQPHA